MTRLDKFEALDDIHGTDDIRHYLEHWLNVLDKTVGENDEEEAYRKGNIEAFKTVLGRLEEISKWKGYSQRELANIIVKMTCNSMGDCDAADPKTELEGIEIYGRSAAYDQIGEAVSEYLDEIPDDRNN